MRSSPADLYKNLSEPVKASLWFTVSNVIQKGIALLSTPVFTRLLTTEQYGVYSVYQSWYQIIIIFATLNLYAGVYNNGMTKWPDKRPQYTSSLLGLSTTITGILLVLYLVAPGFWNGVFDLKSIYMVAIFSECMFAPAYNFWAAGERYDYKYRKLVGVTVLMGLAAPIIGITAVLSTSSYKSEAYVLAYAGVQIAVGIVFYIYDMAKGRRFFDKAYWKFALSFNLPLIPHYLSQTVLNQADRIMISRMVGSGEAAIYSVAYTISMMFTIVTNAINNTFIPYTYKAIRDKEYKKLRSNASFLILMVGAACIVAMAFGPEIIRIFAASEYYEARWVVPPVAEALLFMFIYPLFCNIEFYYEKTKFIMVASSVGAVCNVVLNYIGIQIFGYIAAAYTTLICYAMMALAHYFAHKRICRRQGIHENLYDVKLIMIVVLVSLCVMVFMTLIYDRIFIRYGVIVVICLVAFIKKDKIIGRFKEIRG